MEQPAEGPISNSCYRMTDWSSLHPGWGDRARCFEAKRTPMPPSPTAGATIFVDPDRTSPTAKAPGQQEAIIHLLIVPLKNWIAACGVQNTAAKRTLVFEVSPDNRASTILFIHNIITRQCDHVMVFLSTTVGAAG